ncbi:MAG: OsmC family protein [Actinobacteria bacterium]|nr:OsmC family protein [Actinomycetota bacterium]
MTVISADLIGGTTVRLSNERDVWIADEPLDVGGADGGPNPYELLLGALGACTAITIALYCRRKGIRLDSVSARVELERIHADDCEDCDEGSTGFLERVKSEVFIEGDFDNAQAARLKEIAVRCPVHKTLAQGLQFVETIHVN